LAAGTVSRRLQNASTNQVDFRRMKETSADSRNGSKRQRVNGLRPQLAHRQRVKNLPKYRQFRVRLPPKDTRTNLQHPFRTREGDPPTVRSMSAMPTSSICEFGVTVKGAAVRTRRNAGRWSSRGSRRPTMRVRSGSA